MAAVLNDLRIAVRQHARRPGFAVAVIGTLGLTIGATTAVFSVVNGVLLRPLPGPTPARATSVAPLPSANPSARSPRRECMHYRDRTRTLAGLGAYAHWSASLARARVPQQLERARISGR